MIHDYYFSEAKKFNDLELAKKKKEILNLNKIRDESQNKNVDCFFPTPNDLPDFPENSVLIKISFILKKPFTSKDEGEFHIIDDRITDNPIVRDKFLGLPMVRPSTWKGHLRFAAEKVEWNKEEKKRIVKRLFGSEDKKDETLKGRLYFFPTFFGQDAERDVITPLKRKTRTPTDKGPIPLEVIKPNKKGEFYLLYFPYPKGKDFNKEEVDEDLIFLAESLKLMFYTYGFSAKKTSGFGVIKEKLDDGEIWMKIDGKIDRKQFSKVNDLQNKIEEFWGVKAQ